jgi:hypothetical protein
LEEPALPLDQSLTLTDVAQKTDKEGIAELITCGDRQLNWELTAITSNGSDLDAAV